MQSMRSAFLRGELLHCALTIALPLVGTSLQMLVLFSHLLELSLYRHSVNEVKEQSLHDYIVSLKGFVQ